MSRTLHLAKAPYKPSAIDPVASDRLDPRSAAHHDQVAVAAYFQAEHRGFNGGDPVTDWLAAETEINAAHNMDEDARGY